MTAVATPPPVQELSNACIEYVARAFGAMVLDGTPETLGVLDHYARSVRPDLEKNPALAGLIAPALGAYFGEVLRGRFDGFWLLRSANQHDWTVCSTIAFVALNPIGVGYDALHGGEGHGGPRSELRVASEDREYLNRRLATIPPVAEDEYFLFTTRFEVLEVAVEALTAKMQEEGYGGTRFTEADYGGGPELS